MLNPQKSLIETKKYLKKLKSIIEKQAKFTFIKSKLLDRLVIDDLLCCIEASFPDEYKEFVKKKGGRSLKSYVILKDLQAVIKGRFLFSSSYYSVRHKEAYELIDRLSKTLDYDLNLILSSSSDMF